MGRGAEPRRRTLSTRAGGETLVGIAVLAWTIIVALVLLTLVLMLVGLGVRALSEVVGAPLPAAHDDPGRVEWGGLALLALYGAAGAALLAGCYRLAQRLLGHPARKLLDRTLATAALGAAAVAGVFVAVTNRDISAAIFGVVCGAGAIRVARGLPLDDDDPVGKPAESDGPSVFDTPPVLVDEQLTTRVQIWTPPPRPSFTVPRSRHAGTDGPPPTAGVEASPSSPRSAGHGHNRPGP